MGLQCPFRLLMFLFHRLFPMKRGGLPVMVLWKWLEVDAPSTLFPPSKMRNHRLFRLQLLIEKYLFLFPPWEALKIKTSKNTFLVRRKYFLAASKTPWGLCVCVSANCTVCIPCAFVLSGQIWGKSHTIWSLSLFCLRAWSIHTALIDAKGRGKATAASQHPC